MNINEQTGKDTYVSSGNMSLKVHVYVLILIYIYIYMTHVHFISNLFNMQNVKVPIVFS